MKKFNAVLFILILFLSLGAAFSNSLAQEKELVATVNGVEISKADFYQLLETKYGAYALSELIQRELVRQKAADLQIELGEDEFIELYSGLIAQLGGPQGLQMFLMQNNITEEEFVEHLRFNQLVAELAKSEVDATEEAVTEWFEENRSAYAQKEGVDVSHILLETEDEAENVLQALVGGADFAELALERSMDPSAASNQGRLGRINRGVTVKEFEEKAFSLPIGEYGSVESAYGWHVILVHERFEAKEAQLDEIYELVEDDFKMANALNVESYIKKLEAEAAIEILFGK
ncbi:MAG TPA: hypothetical protein GX528_04165 [Firmicutes bacterium]|nr:hypothetical protein [Bacillota bacterium]